VLKTVTHPHYQYITNKGNIFLINDYAVLTLKKPLDSKLLSSPVCLPTPQMIQKQFVGKNLVATGWGLKHKNDFGKPLPKHLQKTELIGVKNVHCKRDLAKQNINSILCAYGGKQTGMCQGDSGGPLLWQDSTDFNRSYVVGITSFGSSNCAVPVKRPAVFARVTGQLGWIISQASPDVLKCLPK
jgi:secreted trypsin-like serine protease